MFTRRGLFGALGALPFVGKVRARTPVTASRQGKIHKEYILLGCEVPPGMKVTLRDQDGVLLKPGMRYRTYTAHWTCE